MPVSVLEIAALLMEQAFDYLDAPVARVTGKDVPMPYAANLEKLALPQIEDIVATVQATCEGFRGVEMAIDILMPALSPTMETGTLAKWTVAVGDIIRSGDVIAEIETDKATMEVEAVDDGILAGIMVAEGTEGVAVGTPIGRLAEEGSHLTMWPRRRLRSLHRPHPHRKPRHRLPAVAAPAATATIETPQPTPAPAVTSTTRIFASPLARRMADRGVDLASLAGSGPHGRILRRDVEDLQEYRSRWHRRLVGGCSGCQHTRAEQPDAPHHRVPSSDRNRRHRIFI